MSIDIIRAWKDEAYRNSLSEAERALLPENPAGMVDLNDEQLDGIVGGVEGGGDVHSDRATACCNYSTAATACCGL